MKAATVAVNCPPLEVSRQRLTDPRPQLQGPPPALSQTFGVPSTFVPGGDAQDGLSVWPRGFYSSPEQRTRADGVVPASVYGGGCKGSFLIHLSAQKSPQNSSF